MLLISVCVLLTGCGTPIQATPAPTPEAINIIYPAALQPWADYLATCAVQYPDAALYFFQRTALPELANTNDIGLILGQPGELSGGTHQYQVGWEQVVVVVNQKNTVEILSTDSLRQIFSGQILNWKASNQPIQVWVLPDKDPSQQIFTQALGIGVPFASGAMLAPDPLVVVKEVGQDENAIGFLPRRILDSLDTSDMKRLKTVQLDSSMEQALHQPVIAITSGEATGLERDLLACMQNSSP